MNIKNKPKILVATALIDLSYMPSYDEKEVLLYHKRHLLAELLEKEGLGDSFTITFTRSELSPEMLDEFIDRFTRADGRPMYKGEFVTREYLRSELRRLITKLTLTVQLED